MRRTPDVASLINAHSVAAPYAAVAISQRRGLRVWAGAALLLVAMSTHAANMDDWWFYIRNDFWPPIAALIQQGADPNRVDAEGQPTLVQTVRHQAWQTYEGVLKQPSIDLEATNRNGETALMLLSVLGETQRVQHLLDRGARVNKLGWSPLHYAAARGHVDIAQLLIRRQAIINAPSPDGTTPLMMAALSKNETMVQLLLDAGAEPTTQNLSNLNAADWARSANATGLAKKLDGVIAQRNHRLMQKQASQPTPPAAPASLSIVLPEPTALPRPQVPTQPGCKLNDPAAGVTSADCHDQHDQGTVDSMAPAAEDGKHSVRGVRLGAEY
jgi:hypothetical protein